MISNLPIPYISIVSPVYRAENIVPQLVHQIKDHVNAITNDFEIILVEDGSNDESWKAILSETVLDSRVKGIKLSRNFGQHYAITAGIDHARGEWTIVMDCDLQDKPSEIINLLTKAKEGFEIVLARRLERKDNFLKISFSFIFYKFLGYLTGTNQDASIANFGIYHRKVINSIISMREPVRYFPTMVRWVGFRKTTIDVDHGARVVGTSNYNFKRLLNLALDIILANSDKPIRLTVKLGLLVSLSSFIIGILALILYLSGKILVIGYTSLIISIWFLSGLIMMVLGIIGLYVGKTFEGVKNRPIYLIDEIINGN